MKNKGVKRIAVVTSIGAGTSSKDNSKRIADTSSKDNSKRIAVVTSIGAGTLSMKAKTRTIDSIRMHGKMDHHDDSNALR